MKSKIKYEIKRSSLVSLLERTEHSSPLPAYKTGVWDPSYSKLISMKDACPYALDQTHLNGERFNDNRSIIHYQCFNIREKLTNTNFNITLRHHSSILHNRSTAVICFCLLQFIFLKSIDCRQKRCSLFS